MRWLHLVHERPCGKDGTIYLVGSDTIVAVKEDNGNKFQHMKPRGETLGAFFLLPQPTLSPMTGTATWNSPARVLMERLGHTSMETLKLYLAVSITDLK
jgi:hypothetical protein